ncbi:MAG TPA: hypothetical protein VMN36_08895 [Verrucomicrobiales bacterium]|nr:hypothetical protein [Verrucomicrobiales bacterium]
MLRIGETAAARVFSSRSFAGTEKEQVAFAVSLVVRIAATAGAARRREECATIFDVKNAGFSTSLYTFRSA